ncbi:MAG: ATP-binding cassette domain-containing protein [Caldilineales bacterium]|nr:ATP-binding cassette domain-containing protein [Caldilineales bacterium]
MIRLSGVSKTFDGGKTWSLRDVSLEIAPGETIVFLGSSGSGKTTTLKTINRLIDPTEGRVEVDGVDVRRQAPEELRRKIGYVFQGIGLFPHLTIEQNVEMVPRLLGWPRETRLTRARELLELVGLPPAQYGARWPDELSGGQQQRVGVARALAADPGILLMDEPFGALDALTRDSLQQEVLDLKRRLKKTIVFVTHDIFEALTLGDRIAVFHAGRMEQLGTREDLLARPATPFVRDLFGKPAQQLAAFQGVLG